MSEAASAGAGAYHEPAASDTGSDESPRRPVALIVAGIGSLLMGLCCGACGALGMLSPMMQEAQIKKFDEIQREIKASQEQQRKELEEQKAKTTDPQEIAQIDQQLAFLNTNTQPFPDMKSAYEAMYPPKVKRFYSVGGIVELLLNGLMLVTGIALLAMVPWSRPLGNTVAGAKIVSALVFGLLYLTVVVPVMVAGMQKMQQAMLQQMQSMPGAPPGGMPAMPGMTGAMTGWYAIMGVVGILVACVWPTVLLILLNVKSSREALAAPRRAGA